MVFDLRPNGLLRNRIEQKSSQSELATRVDKLRSAGKGILMGKQRNKIEKRRRRRDYIQRKKNAAKAVKR
jgi:hypothetical protein